MDAWCTPLGKVAVGLGDPDSPSTRNAWPRGTWGCMRSTVVTESDGTTAVPDRDVDVVRRPEAPVDRDWPGPVADLTFPESILARESTDRVIEAHQLRRGSLGRRRGLDRQRQGEEADGPAGDRD